MGILDDIIEYKNRLFKVPIKSSGKSNIKITRDADGKWYANGRPMAEGYTYYDNGNTFKIINGERKLISQTKEAKARSQKWIQQMNQQTAKYKAHDDSIANKSTYGWNTLNATQGTLTRRRLKRNIDVTSRWNPLSCLMNGISYMFNTGAWLDSDVSKGATESDKNIWYRHLGFPRDQEAMPVTGIRFRGDIKNRKPNAEYSGLTKQAKQQILKDIHSGDIQVFSNGDWSPVKEGLSYNRNATEQYANYAIRENNNSGIYDVFDTYDFPNHWYTPSLNRSSGYQIEIRDTIHGPNADDRLYNPNFTKRK